MKSSSLVAVLALSLAFGCVGSTPDETEVLRDAVGEPVVVLVAFHTGADEAEAASLVADAGGTLLQFLPEIAAGLAEFSSEAAAEGMSGVVAVGAHRFQALPEGELEGGVEAGDPPALGYFDDYQWALHRVNAPEAWEVTTGSHDTVVAVIDTGVAWNHPDLAPNVVFATCAAQYGPCNPYPTLSYHGTHVAGTIAAAEGYGVVGVGPDLGIASYNVFEYIEGWGVGAFDFPIFVSMIDAAARGFDVINMSLGGYVVRPASREDVAAWTLWNRVANYVTGQGVTIVASSGNDALDLNGPVSHTPSDLPAVISVAATGIGPYPIYPYPGAYDVQAFYSNEGASVTVAAPGGDLGPDPSVGWARQHLVFSTYVFVPGSCYTYDDAGVCIEIVPEDCAETYSCPAGWAWAGGTSMASPHVAGVAALVADVRPGLSARQVSNVVKRTAESLGDRHAFGHGMVDAYAAVTD